MPSTTRVRELEATNPPETTAMPRYDEYDELDDYDDIRIDRPRAHAPAPKSQPGLGLASIGIAVVMIIAFPILLGFTAIVGHNMGAQDNDPVATGIGLGFLLLVGIILIGLVLGIIGCCQPNRSMIPGLIGSILNALVLFGIAALVCMGLALGG